MTQTGRTVSCLLAVSFLIFSANAHASTPDPELSAGFQAMYSLDFVSSENHLAAYVWPGVTNYVVATLPLSIRWVARLRGYPASKQDAVGNLKIAAEKGSLWKPYAKILLAVTYLRENCRENKKAAAQAVIAQLATEFPTNTLYAKHARRLAH